MYQIILPNEMPTDPKIKVEEREVLMHNSPSGKDSRNWFFHRLGQVRAHLPFRRTKLILERLHAGVIVYDAELKRYTRFILSDASEHHINEMLKPRNSRQYNIFVLYGIESVAKECMLVHAKMPSVPKVAARRIADRNANAAPIDHKAKLRARHGVTARG